MTVIYIDPITIRENRARVVTKRPPIVVREQFSNYAEMVYRTFEVNINGAATIVYKPGRPLFKGGPEVWVTVNPLDVTFKGQDRELVSG